MSKHRSNALLYAGLLPLPWFLVFTTLGGWTAPGYHMLSQHASELLAFGGLPSWLMSIAAIGSGAAFVLFSIGVWRESRRRLSLGGLAWALFGLSMISNGVWPMGTPMHGLYALGLINLIAPAMCHLDLDTRLNSRPAYAMTAFISLAGVLYLWMNLTGMDPAPYRGLTQRLFSSIAAAWPFAVAWRSYAATRR